MPFFYSILHFYCDGEFACSGSDRQGSNFESCVWREVSSPSSHHLQEVLLAQFSLYVHKGSLKPHSFHFIFKSMSFSFSRLYLQNPGYICYCKTLHKMIYSHYQGKYNLEIKAKLVVHYFSIYSIGWAYTNKAFFIFCRFYTEMTQSISGGIFQYLPVSTSF